jgi:hypothetical protein
MEPGRAHPTRLSALEVGHRDDHASARAQDARDLGEGASRVGQVLEHVPYDHLVEVRIGVPGVGQSRRDAHVGPRVPAARGLGADLDPVHLEAAIRQGSQDHPAATADVEHPGAALEATRQECDVTRGDDANEALDQRLELHTGLAVVFFRIEGAHLLRARHRMEPSQAALLTHDDGRGDALHREARPRRGVAAHDARGYRNRIRGGASQRQNAEPVEIRVRRSRDASGPHGSRGACGARRQRSREERSRIARTSGSTRAGR